MTFATSGIVGNQIKACISEPRHRRTLLDPRRDTTSGDNELTGEYIVISDHHDEDLPEITMMSHPRLVPRLARGTQPPRPPTDNEFSTESPTTPFG